MPLNKQQLIQRLLNELESLKVSAIHAATRAHETATHEENKAENKYDTLGLEAAYLAHGQSKRVAECEADLLAFQSLSRALNCNEESAKDDLAVALGSWVTVLDEKDMERDFFLGPSSGGLKVEQGGVKVVVITPGAPLGRALLGKNIDDDVSLNLGKTRQTYTIIRIQ